MLLHWAAVRIVRSRPHEPISQPTLDIILANLIRAIIQRALTQYDGFTFLVLLLVTRRRHTSGIEAVTGRAARRTIVRHLGETEGRNEIGLRHERLGSLADVLANRGGVFARTF